jgi:transglutaminase-like putative cysteine protease
LIDKAVAEVSKYALSTRSAARGAATAKARARTALIAYLRAMGVTARAIRLDTRGLEGKFRFPNSQKDQAYITTGLLFARDARAFERPFIAHGMLETFLADLNDVVENFNQAIRSRSARKGEYVAARAGIAAALASDLAAARRLDAIVTNCLRDDPVRLAVWEQDRRVG